MLLHEFEAASARALGLMQTSDAHVVAASTVGGDGDADGGGDGDADGGGDGGGDGASHWVALELIARKPLLPEWQRVSFVLWVPATPRSSRRVSTARRVGAVRHAARMRVM